MTLHTINKNYITFHFRHLHFYGVWCRCLLTHHGLWLKSKSVEHMPILNLLHRNITTKTKNLGELCERNLYTMEFLITMAELKKLNVKNQNGDEKESGIESDSDQDEVLMDTDNVQGLQCKWSDDSESE